MFGSPSDETDDTEARWDCIVCSPAGVGCAVGEGRFDRRYGEIDTREAGRREYGDGRSYGKRRLQIYERWTTGSVHLFLRLVLID